jgi:hypothetical protein
MGQKHCFWGVKGLLLACNVNAFRNEWHDKCIARRKRQADKGEQMWF